MRRLMILVALAFGLSACFGGYAGDRSYYLLNDPLRDYYHGKGGNPSDTDPDFVYGWDIGP